MLSAIETAERGVGAAEKDVLGPDVTMMDTKEVQRRQRARERGRDVLCDFGLAPLDFWHQPAKIVVGAGQAAWGKRTDVNIRVSKWDPLIKTSL